jgi:hypothetical protein
MAVKAPLYIEQGTDFISEILLLDPETDETVDTSGVVAAGKIKKHYDSINSVSFSTSVANGSLFISLSANTTNNMKHGRYVYDVEITDTSNNTMRIVEGILTLTPSVTK